MPHPAVMAGDDPVGTWRAARVVPSGDELNRMVAITGLGELPVAALLSLSTTELTVHTWDIGCGLGLPARLPPPLVTASFDWARAHVVRRPGFFGPEVTPAPDADEQARMLAFLGRAG